MTAIIKHKELEIDSENPFKNCRLKRQSYAEALTSIIKSYADGFVMSINNEWGTGKTTFVKMLQAHLTKEGLSTIYFNAWEHDFEGNPLTAIISELKTLKRKQNENAFDGLVQKAGVIIKSALPGAINMAAQKIIGLEAVEEIARGFSEAAGEIMKQEIDEYLKRKNSLIEFRKKLEDFLKNAETTTPVVFVIDELDRCRPNYAVEVLENVKHFFNVPGIVFILSIDKIQLGNAIKGFYGSESLNSNEYLRRFIDLEFMLPRPDTKTFVNYLYEYFDFRAFLDNDERTKHRELKNDGAGLIRFSALLFEQSELTLRQQEKIFAHASVVLKAFNSNQYILPDLLIFLIYARDYYPKFYQKLSIRKADPQELCDDLKVILPFARNNEDISREFQYLEVSLITTYYRYFNEVNYKAPMIERDDEGNNKLLIKPAFDNPNGKSVFLELFESSWFRPYRDIKISHLINKIDFMENLHIS